MTLPTQTETGFQYDFGWIGDIEATGVKLDISGDDLVFDTDGSLISGALSGYSTTIYFAEFTGLEDRVIASVRDVREDWPELADTSVIDSMYLLSVLQLVEAAKARDALDSAFDTFGEHITTGLSDVTLRGTGLDEAFALLGENVVLKTGAGRDFVETLLANGRNYINLGQGDDLFTGGIFENRVWGGSGDDTLTGGDVADKLVGGSGWDKVWGGAGNDIVKGGIGRDSVGGGAGDDILQGGAGRDNLFAGAGNDRLWGGEGGDAFIFNVDPYHWHNVEVGHNRVMDFDLSEDKLRLGPSSNGTWDQDDAMERFLDAAQERSWGTAYKEDGMNIYLLGVALEDLTIDHFVDAQTAGSYDDWLYA